MVHVKDVQAAKIKGGVGGLPPFPNRCACFLHIMGKCKWKCLSNCKHLDKEELPQATFKELCSMLAPGMAAMCNTAGVGTPLASKI